MRPWLLMTLLPLVGCAGLQSLSNPRGSLTQSGKAEIQLAVAQNCERSGDIQGAIDNYKSLVDKHPKQADAWHRLGLLHDRQGQAKAATEYYRESLAINKDQPKVWNDLGYNLYLQESWSESEQAFQEAIRRGADDPRARINYGLLLARTNRLDQAMQQFAAANITEAEARCNLAVALMEEGQLAQAHQQLHAASQLNASQSVAEKIFATQQLCSKLEIPDERLATQPQPNTFR